MKHEKQKEKSASEFGFTPKQAKRLTTRKGNDGYCMIESRDGQQYCVNVVADNGRYMSMWLAGTDGKIEKSIFSDDYKDYKIILDGDEVIAEKSGECEHENTVFGELPELCSYEYCRDCQLSRAIDEFGDNEWVDNKLTTKFQTALDLVHHAADEHERLKGAFEDIVEYSSRQAACITKLERDIAELEKELEKQGKIAILLAKLSADKPMFYSPLITCKAAALRDEILGAVSLPEKDNKEMTGSSILICGGCSDKMDINFEGITCNGCGIELCINCQSKDNCPQCDYKLETENNYCVPETESKICYWKYHQSGTYESSHYMTDCGNRHNHHLIQIAYCPNCDREIKETEANHD